MNHRYVYKSKSRYEETAKSLNYGRAYIVYKGPSPILFTTTAVSSGISAVIGYKEGGPVGAVILGIIGAIIGSVIGSLLEGLIRTMLKNTSYTSL